MMTSWNMTDNIQELKMMVNSTITPNIAVYILTLGKKNTVKISHISAPRLSQGNNNTMKSIIFIFSDKIQRFRMLLGQTHRILRREAKPHWVYASQKSATSLHML